MADQKNLLLAIVISVAIILISQFLLPGSKPPPQGGPQTAGATVPGGAGPQAPGGAGSAGGGAAPRAPGTPGTAGPSAPGSGSSARASGAPGTPGTPGTPGAAGAAGENRAAILRRSKRVRIDTPKLSGSIALTGARLDDVTLRRYRTELAKTSPNITLLEPEGAPNAYFVEFGWVTTNADKGIKRPGPTSVWTADREVLAPGRPVTLTWDNGEGLKFERRYEIDKDYLVTVTQAVVNDGTTAVALFPFALIRRFGTPETSGWYVLDEGPYWVTRNATDDGGSKTNFSYDTIKDQTKQETTVGGWVGITDRYWTVAIAPRNDAKVTSTIEYNKGAPRGFYQAFFVHQTAVSVPAGGRGAVTNNIFAGAKEVSVIDRYEESPGILRFDLAMDYGWFFFLTKPIFKLLNIFYHYVGNFGVAILLLTVLIKILFFPLANKSYKAMGKMKALTPKMQQIKERFGDNKELQNRELMELYKREKVNPMAGCWPILIQIPVFFALYKVLLINIEMRHAPFFWWIQDLSARDPTSVLNLFGLLPFQPPTDGIVGIISIGVWPLLMGISMWLQQRLNPAPPDPMQARIFMMLPIVFTFMLAPFAAGLVIYWTWNNLLSMAQQWTIMKRHGQLSQATAPHAGSPPKKKPAAANSTGRRAKARAKAAGADGTDGTDGGEATADEAPADEAPEPAAEDGGAEETPGGAASTRPAPASNRGRAQPAKRGRSRRRSR